MENPYLLSYCQDGSCCCLSLRSTTAFISTISLVACLLDAWAEDGVEIYSGVDNHVESFKQLLNRLFQMANVLLLIVSVVGNSTLVQLYLYYAMAFVSMGLVVNLIDFLRKFQCQGLSSFYVFTIEVLFLFVIYRCLPVVDTYRKHLIEFSF